MAQWGPKSHNLKSQLDIATNFPLNIYDKGQSPKLSRTYSERPLFAMNGHEYRLMASQDVKNKRQLSDNPKQGIYIPPLKLRKNCGRGGRNLRVGISRVRGCEMLFFRFCRTTAGMSSQLDLHWAHRIRDLSITSHGPDSCSLLNFGFCRLERRGFIVFSYVPMDESIRL